MIDEPKLEVNQVDNQYLSNLRDLLNLGIPRQGRNGVTYGLFGTSMRFDLEKGFPLLTTKKVHFKSILVELLWFLKGDTNTRFLHDHKVTIWDKWADEDGDLGPVYGKQWRSWDVWDEFGNHETIDQIKNVIEGIKRDPNSRRHIVTAWNPADVDQMALPPCHCLFQFHVAYGRLSCHLYQRSADWFLGVPFNIASYALLTILIARETNLIPGDFIHSFGDYHLYDVHRLVAAEQILLEPKKTLPTIKINVDYDVSIFDLKVEDIELVNYDSYPAIKAEVIA